tara:strand:- start:661 stop:1149 length:489 start_codon:yes stop_codon:yes gene_type:complete
MKKIALLIILMSTAVISGCGTYMQVKDTFLNPTDYDVQVVKQEQHYQNDNVNNGSLYVVWSSTVELLADSFSGIYINVDGKQVGAVTWKTYTVLSLKPGAYKVSLGSQDDQVDVTVVANQSVYYRAGIDKNLLALDTLTLNKVEDIAAAKESIKDLTYVVLK